MSNGIFDSSAVAIPAVNAKGINGAHGLNAVSDTGTAIAATSNSSSCVEAIQQGGFAGIAVHGQSNAQTGIGVKGEGPQIGVNGVSQNVAVRGTAFPAGIGVLGEGGTGVSGYTTTGIAVSGQSDAQTGIGVKGEGRQYGVEGISSSGIGVHGSGSKGAGFFEGNVTVTGDVILTGADCAEEFDTARSAEIEPGTVMVLDQDGALQHCQQAYDKRVAGVISGAGDYKPGLILDRQQTHDDRVPVALVGKVYCKVDAQYAPIEIGDLLTTSPTPGHAMKAHEPFRAFGAVIGKALRPLHEGSGLIPILIALQ